MREEENDTPLLFIIIPMIFLLGVIFIVSIGL